MASPTQDEDWRWLLLHCAACDSVIEQGLHRQQLTRTTRGEFVPVSCSRCGAKAASPTVRPWDLSFNDRKMLRTMRIAVE